MAEESTPLQPKNFDDDPDKKKKQEAPKKERLVSLDTFRGMTIALMMLVNNAGGSFPLFEHAHWNGATFADFVMPWFLYVCKIVIFFARFIVGASVAVAIGKMLYQGKASRWDLFKKALVRTIKLFLLGLFLQGADFPKYDLSTIRIPGVLQRIAYCYFVVSCVVIFVPALPFPPAEPEITVSQRSFSTNMAIYDLDDENEPRKSTIMQSISYMRSHKSPVLVFIRYLLYWIICFLISAIYLTLLYAVDVPNCGRGQTTPACNSAGYIDYLILTPKHMYNSPTCRPDCPYFDPEGLLSTFGAAALCFYGLYFGYVLVHYPSHKQRLFHWILLGLAFTGIGIAAHFAGIPWNKNLFSISYQWLTAGTAGLVLSLCYMLQDEMPAWKGKTVINYILMPFTVLGMNSIAVYAGDEFSKVIFGDKGGGSAWFYWASPNNSILNLFYQYCLASWLPEQWANFVWAICDVLFWMLIAFVLYKKKIFYKI